MWDDNPSNEGIEDTRWLDYGSLRDWSDYQIRLGKLFAHRHRYFADERW
jgi:hypothetical protein